MKIRIVSFYQGDFEVDYVDYKQARTLHEAATLHLKDDPDVFVDAADLESKYDGTTLMIREHEGNADAEQDMTMEFTEVTNDIFITIVE